MCSHSSCFQHLYAVFPPAYRKQGGPPGLQFQKPRCLCMYCKYWTHFVVNSSTLVMKKWLMVAFLQLRFYFCKLKGKLPGVLFRLVWQEPHSATPWLRHCNKLLLDHHKQILFLLSCTCTSGCSWHFISNVGVCTVDGCGWAEFPPCLKFIDGKYSMVLSVIVW